MQARITHGGYIPKQTPHKGGYFTRIIWLRRPSVLDIGKVCLCNTNRRLYHKDLGESFKVITVDKSAVEYYRKLSELTAQIHKIGVLYNQTVRAINSYHSVKTAQLLLEKLENLSLQIIMLQQKTIQLTEQFDRR